MYILTESHSFEMLMVIAVVVNTVKRPSRLQDVKFHSFVLFCFSISNGSKETSLCLVAVNHCWIIKRLSSETFS